MNSGWCSKRTPDKVVHVQHILIWISDTFMLNFRSLQIELYRNSRMNLNLSSGWTSEKRVTTRKKNYIYGEIWTVKKKEEHAGRNSTGGGNLVIALSELPNNPYKNSFRVISRIELCFRVIPSHKINCTKIKNTFATKINWTSAPPK